MVGREFTYVATLKVGQHSLADHSLDMAQLPGSPTFSAMLVTEATPVQFSLPMSPCHAPMRSCCSVMFDRQRGKFFEGL